MSTKSRGKRAGAAEASQPTPKERRISNPSGSEASKADSPPFSPFGKHSVVRALLLAVGGVLSRDEDGSLSGVSVNELRRALSTFLSQSRASDGRPKPRKGSSEGSTSKADRSEGSKVSSLTEKEVLAKYEKRMKLQSEDRARIRRLLEWNQNGD